MLHFVVTVTLLQLELADVIREDDQALTELRLHLVRTIRKFEAPKQDTPMQ